MSQTQVIIYIALSAFFLNIPFGHLRNFTRKFSWQWFLCIHTPIPVLAYFRIKSGIPWHYIFLFLFLAILGQVVGARLKNIVNWLIGNG